MKKNKITILVLIMTLVMHGVMMVSETGIAFANQDNLRNTTEEGGSVGPALPEPVGPPTVEDDNIDDTTPPVEDEGGTEPPGSGSGEQDPPTDESPPIEPTPGGNSNQYEPMPETSLSGSSNENSTGGEASQTISTKLTDLSISCGTLVPSFSPDVFEYVVYVTKTQDNKSCEVFPTAQDTQASIIFEGPAQFEDIDVERKIIVSDGQEGKSEYAIRVHVVKETELLLGEKLYALTHKPDLKTLPDGFKKYSYSIDGTKVTLASNKGETLLMGQFITEMGEKDSLWCIFNKREEKFFLTEIIEIDGSKYVIVSTEEDKVYGKGPTGLGYYHYNPDTGEVRLLENENGNDNIRGLLINIFLIAITATLLLAIAYVFLKKRGRGKKEEESVGSKYFAPYISLKDEDE